MPEFLGRPNLPNALANSLVQLAASETNPITVGIQSIGKLADTYTEQQMRTHLLEKQNALQEKSADKQHERAKELEVIKRDSTIYESLLKNDRIVAGLMGQKGGDMTAGDASRLIGSGANTTKKMVEKDFGTTTPKGKGVPLSSVGVKIPGDPSFIPAKETVEIDEAMAKQYKLPGSMIGKLMTMDQVVRLRNQDSYGRSGAGRSHPDWAKFYSLAQKSLDPETPIEVISEAADTMLKDSLASQADPGSLGKDATKKAAEEAAAKKNQKSGISIFGFNFGGDKKAVTPDEQPKKSTVGAGPEELAIRAEYQAGKITKEQAKAKILALRAKTK